MILIHKSHLSYSHTFKRLTHKNLSFKTLKNCTYNGDLKIKKFSFLNEKLKEAIDKEDYKDAARIRDIISEKNIDTYNAILNINDKFYKAFENADLNNMQQVWSSNEKIQCIHPEQPCIHGYDFVMESWTILFHAIRKVPITIEIQDIEIYFYDSLAILTCIEIIKSSKESGFLTATNIFENINNEWYLIHHQASPIEM